MWSHKAIRIVEEQFIKINNEVRKMSDFFSFPGAETKISFRDEILKLHNSVFDLLVGGEELPIYRGNYIEISEQLVKFCDSLENLFSAFRNIPPEEMEQMTTIPEIMEAVREAVSCFLGTWLNLGKHLRKSEEEIKAAAGFIFQLECAVSKNCRGDSIQNKSSALLNFCDRCDSLIQSLYAIDLSLKKLIVMRVV